MASNSDNSEVWHQIKLTDGRRVDIWEPALVEVLTYFEDQKQAKLKTMAGVNWANELVLSDEDRALLSELRVGVD
jgi:hypothetical protein